MSLTGRRLVVVAARGGDYRPGASRAPYDHEESYLRDFFAGHFAIEDPVFTTAELANSRVDPLLVERLPERQRSYQQALAATDRIARSPTAWKPASIARGANIGHPVEVASSELMTGLLP